MNIYRKCTLNDDERGIDDKKDDNSNVRRIMRNKQIRRVVSIKHGQNDDPYHEKPLDKTIGVIFAHKFLEIFPDAPGNKEENDKIKDINTNSGS